MVLYTLLAVYGLCVLCIAYGMLVPVSKQYNLISTIEKLVQIQRYPFLIYVSAEVCIITTNVSTLQNIDPDVMTTLISEYPVKFATEKPVKYAKNPKYANVVLLDATGWEKFPVMRLAKQFNDNPCHMIDARFIVLVTRSCFLTDRSAIVQFFDGQGIVNYVIFPTRSSASEPVDNITLYTENRFSKEEVYVPLGDLDNLHRLFPNKLTKLNGYPIRVGVKQNEYPYIMVWYEGTLVLGVARNMIVIIGDQHIQTSSSYFHQTNDRYDADAYFGFDFKREHFQHDLVFREMGGMCISCPDRLNRHFIPHLLKPFSFKVWIFLGIVFIVCCLLRLLFPTIFRYDLISQTLFGVIDHEYNHAYPARAVLFILSLLSFFFSRTYCAKILALMSLGKFYSRPETIADFMQSDYMLAVHKETLAQFVLDDFASKILPLAEFESLRKQGGISYHRTYCSLQRCSDAYLLASSWLTGARSKYFFIKQIVVPFPHKIQFAANSPFFAVMKRYLGLLYDSGLWEYEIDGHMDILKQKPETKHAIARVVFLFDDLWSVWMLLVGGWVSSIVMFVMELISKKRA